MDVEPIMTPDEAREALIERVEAIIRESLVAGGVVGEYSESLGFTEEAIAAVDAILSARATCLRCGGAKLIETPTSQQTYHPGVCPSCGGEPGVLLVLQALGGERAQGAMVECGADDFQHAIAKTAEPLWRFPIPSTPEEQS